MEYLADTKSKTDGPKEWKKSGSTGREYIQWEFLPDDLKSQIAREYGFEIKIDDYSYKVLSEGMVFRWTPESMAQHRNSVAPQIKYDQPHETKLGFRYCSTCNRVFETVEEYRSHHFNGKCGGLST